MGGAAAVRQAQAGRRPAVAPAPATADRSVSQKLERSDPATRRLMRPIARAVILVAMSLATLAWVGCKRTKGVPAGGGGGGPRGPLGGNDPLPGHLWAPPRERVV